MVMISTRNARSTYCVTRPGSLTGHVSVAAKSTGSTDRKIVGVGPVHTIRHASLCHDGKCRGRICALMSALLSKLYNFFDTNWTDWIWSWWRHQMEKISALLAICAGNSPVPGEFPAHKGQRRGALMFALICVWINGWVNNREAGDLSRYRAHYDVTVMIHPT